MKNGNADDARERLKHLDHGFEVDDDAEDERLSDENPAAYHKRRIDEAEHEFEQKQAAKRRLTKT
jgi:hypothetical protein